ncbi:MAG: beta-lactamase [Proteobacteria bacterium]|nr:beta-lactamase [Pseudomonadota bacterium]
MAVAVLCVPAASRADDDAARIAAAVDRAYRPLLKQYGIPGMAVAVAVNGQQHFFNFGVAAKGRNAPVTRDTLFEIGSVSKTFTATLAAYAVDRGALALDAHPSTYMPELRGAAIDGATVLNFGTYSAGGLPLQLPASVNNDATMLAYFKAFKPAAAPGERRQYSNPSLGLFGHLAALAMKRDFADVMERDIFPQLGLKDSYVRVPAAAMERYAWGIKGDKAVRVNPAVFAAETYGVKTSAADMLHFVEVNMAPDKLDAPMRRAVEATHVGYFKIGAMVQGLGWEQYDFPVTLETLRAGNSADMIFKPQAATPLSPPRAPQGATLFDKTGSTTGFGSYVAFVPARKIGLVMLANRNFPIPARIDAAHAVLETLAALPR